MCCLWCWCELAKAGEQIYFSKGVFGLLMNLESNKLEYFYLVVIFNSSRRFNVLHWPRIKCTSCSFRTGFIGDGLVIV